MKHQKSSNIKPDTNKLLFLTLQFIVGDTLTFLKVHKTVLTVFRNRQHSEWFYNKKNGRFIRRKSGRYPGPESGEGGRWRTPAEKNPAPAPAGHPPRGEQIGGGPIGRRIGDRKNTSGTTVLPVSAQYECRYADNLRNGVPPIFFVLSNDRPSYSSLETSEHYFILSAQFG